MTIWTTKKKKKKETRMMMKVGSSSSSSSVLLPSSGRRRNRIGKQFHRRQQSTSQGKLRIYYALMLAFVLFVIVSMIVVSIKVLRMDSGGGDGEKFQLSFKITWSPSSCYISNGTLAKNCPLPSNQFKLPDYTQGFIITELKRAQEDDPDSLCKKSAVKFEQDKLSTDIRSRLNRYWPSLVNPDSAIDLWKSHYERYGRCVPTVLPVNDQTSYEQDKYFSKALELREKVYKSVTANMDKILKSKGQQQVNSTIQDQFPTETISYDTLKRILRIPIDSTVGSFSVPANYVTAYSDCEYIRDQFVFQSLVVCANEKGILEECQPEYQKYLANFDARCKSPNVTFPLLITKKKK